MSTRTIAAVALLVTPLLLGSCAAVPVPILASAGVDVAQASTAAFIRGSLRAAFPYPRAVVSAAVLKTAADLRYASTRKERTRYVEEIMLRPLQGEFVEVRLETSTDSVTLVSIRVGVLGDQAVSRLVLGEIERRLREGVQTPKNPAQPPPSDTPSPPTDAPAPTP